MNGRFDDCILSEFPQQDVADHEAFLSFINDSEGIAFNDWWSREGASAFESWYEQNKSDYE